MHDKLFTRHKESSDWTTEDGFDHLRMLVYDFINTYPKSLNKWLDGPTSLRQAALWSLKDQIRTYAKSVH